MNFESIISQQHHCFASRILHDSRMACGWPPFPLLVPNDGPSGGSWLPGGSTHVIADCPLMRERSMTTRARRTDDELSGRVAVGPGALIVD